MAPGHYLGKSDNAVDPSFQRARVAQQQASEDARRRLVASHRDIESLGVTGDLTNRSYWSGVGSQQSRDPDQSLVADRSRFDELVVRKDNHE